MKKTYFKTLLFIFLIAPCMQIQAQDYLVTFTTSGGFSQPDSVQVENLEQGTFLTLNGDDVLHLLDIYVGVADVAILDNTLKIYPNPMRENTVVEINNIQAGEVNIRIIDITGKTVVQHSANLPQGSLSYRLSGLSNGTYLVNIKSAEQTEGVSSVIISQGISGNKPHIELINVQGSNNVNDGLKSVNATIPMHYYDGETLVFTAWYDGISSVEELIITESQTIAFEFIETVTDIEGNVYPVYTIGNQTWMQENLKTTKLNNGDSIPYLMSNLDWTTATDPAVNWFEHNQVYADANKMGALYNWFAVETGMLCPTGWHVPTNDEFEEFVFYLAANGYNYDGTIYEGSNIDVAGEKIGKALAVKSGWLPPTYGEEWAIGKDPHLNNSSSFNGVGASGRYMMTGVFGSLGYLCNWWTSTAFDTDHSWTYFMYTEEALLIKTWYFKEGGYSVRCIKDSE